MRKSFLMLCLSLLGASQAMAYDFTATNEDGVTIYYNINEDGTVSVTCKSIFQPRYSGVVKIPPMVYHESAFYLVTDIGDNAFNGCTDLTEVVMNPYILSIGKNAFNNCSGMSSVNLPGVVRTIGNNAFARCTGLTEMWVNNNDPADIELGETVFMNTPVSSCTLHVPGGASDLYKEADQWKDFGSYSENSTYDFSAVNEDGVTIYYLISEDGGTVSVSCKSLFEPRYSGVVKIPSKVSYNEKIYNVTDIEAFAFTGCTDLTEVILHNGISSIGRKAFNGCSALTAVTIPQSVYLIAREAFAGCTGLTDVTIETSDPFDIMLGNDVFVDVPLASCTLHVPLGSTGKYEVAEQWQDFGEIVEPRVYDFAAQNADGVTIYYKVNYDGITVSVAFKDLTYNSYEGKVAIPASVTYDGVDYRVTDIGEDAFALCSNLKDVVIPTSVTGIGAEAFYSSSLRELIIPVQIATIGNCAFGICTDLERVTVENRDPEEIEVGGDLFDGVELKNCVLYVPVGCLDLYAYAPEWGKFGKIVELDWGDANGDMTIDAGDIAYVIGYMLGTDPTGFLVTIADMDDNGVIDAGDIAKIISTMLTK